MPYIREASDLHLESHDKFRLPSLPEDKDTILVLSGDICVVEKIKRFIPFFEDVSKRFKYVVYVPGNHEYYGTSILRAADKFKQSVKFDNLFFLEKDYVILDDIVFIGTTLWTNFNKGNEMDLYFANQMMNDYKCIRSGTIAEPYKYKFKAEMSLSLHLKQLEFLEKTLEANKGKQIVVVTHHSPCRLSVDVRFNNHIMNPAYFSDLSEVVFKYEPKIWFHGHMHSNSDYQLYDTRIICNPKGYTWAVYEDGSSSYENKDFNPFLRIEL